ncbi:hypothetical protein HI850_007795 [bacterium SPL81]|nr:hypothetical protein [Acinetobacter baumannii]
MIVNELYVEVANLLDNGKMRPSIADVARKAFVLLNEVTASQKSEIVGLERWSKMYQTRHKILLQKQRDCGGFEETLALVAGLNGPIDLILLESNPYVSMFLLDRNSNLLIGALYIQRDKDSM